MKVESYFAGSFPVVFRLAAGVAAGSALVQRLPALPGAWAFPVLAALCGVCVRRQLPMGAALAFGLLWALGFGQFRLGDRLPSDAGRQSALVEGRILGLPQPMGRGVRFDFEVAGTLEAAVAVPRKLRLSWYDPPAAPPRAGEAWRLRVSLRGPRGLSNPGGLDYEQWLFEQGIGALGYVRNSASNLRLADGGERFWSAAVWRRELHGRLAAVLAGSEVAGLMEALTLGVDDSISPRQWEVLRRTGTVHLIAISGSHIGLIAALAFAAAQWLCTCLGLARWPPPAVAAFAAFAAAGFYSALAGFSIPTQRALIMVGVAMGAVVLRRNFSPLRVLATALLAVVLYDPMAVLAPGCWLSFGAVALIAYATAARVGSPQSASSASVDLPRARRSSRLRRLAAPLRWLGGLIRKASVLLKINWFTAFGLAPLLFLFFKQVSLVSPLANLLAVPVLGAVLMPLCLAGALLLPVAPETGAALLKLGEWLLMGFWPVLKGLSAWPWAQWTRADPPLWTFPPALLGALLLLAPHGIPARWLGVVLLLPALAARVERPLPGAFRLALLDVGQGLATVVETRHRVLVFDTGARLGPDFDMGSAVVEPYLRQRGVRAIDLLVVSHGDNDHSGGARSLFELLPVAAVYTSAPERLAGLPVAPCYEGQHWRWDGVDFDMLGPLGADGKENDRSCVLRVRGARGSALLTGDIERAAENRLAERYGAGLGSDILVVPHHGSDTSSTMRFLEAVRPRYALIPAGHLNRFGFPRPAVLARYAAIGAATLNTAEAGAIEILVGEPTPPRLHRPEYRRYWREK
jgi:competence protein ComEC